MTRVVGAVWGDATGRSRLTILRGSTNPCTVLAALQPLSNAGILWNWDGPLDGAIGLAVAAEYEGVKQWAQLVFQTATGGLIRVTLPAPHVGIFKADKQTVDPVAIAAFIAAAIGQLADQNGNVATAYIGGTLEPDRSDLTPIGT